MINNKIIYQVDAFTQKAFKGNPAGVMIVDASVTDVWMQQIALEMNLSETAFVIPDNDAFIIRFFTPTVEIPLCGHATLASAHLLYELGYVALNQKILFKAKGGDLIIKQSNGEICMDFPTYILNKNSTPSNFKNLVGFEPIEFYTSESNWKIAVAASEKDILDALPNFEALSSNNLGLLMITSVGDISKTDYVVRCFAPDSGIDEDPVTGSAQCGLVPLWTSKLNKTELTCRQVSARTGDLNLQSIGDRIEIKGRAITIFEAFLKI